MAADKVFKMKEIHYTLGRLLIKFMLFLELSKYFIKVTTRLRVIMRINRVRQIVKYQYQKFAKKI